MGYKSKITFSFRVNETLSNQLDKIAKYFDRSRSWIIRKALEEFVERETRSKRIVRSKR